MRTTSGVEVLPLEDQADVVQARQRARDHAVALGFGLVAQTKLVTAVSELARNAVVHGRGGQVQLREVTRGARSGLRLVFSDHGPGIDDVEQALTDGWSSGDGLGLGLGGSRRLVDEFGIESGRAGTVVTITVWSA